MVKRLNARELVKNQVLRCFRCGSLCKLTQCFAWSWLPEGRNCIHYNSFTPTSVTYTPNPSVHTYVALAPAPDLEYVVLKSNAVSWRDAQMICSSVGAVLAYRIDFLWLWRLKRLHGVKGFFLGLKKESISDRHWKDESGGTVPNSAISWAEFQPKEKPNKLCVIMQYRMMAVGCDKKINLALLCKMQF
ncbi:uncharacterized protein LOC119568325 [Penaeus monodon]|uniref:uncharacterized protein LOC119568325 n=1 Tax=Penaeus monodon TaxID=6687 RepID=UPI0018A6EF11|nr:uncharacterized protein LOC119568325 [Penaeus monodon]